MSVVINELEVVVTPEPPTVRVRPTRPPARRRRRRPRRSSCAHVLRHVADRADRARAD